MAIVCKLMTQRALPGCQFVHLWSGEDLAITEQDPWYEAGSGKCMYMSFTAWQGGPQPHDALQGFARGLGQAAPGLDIKPLLVPYLPLQLLLLILPEARSSGDKAAAQQQRSMLNELHSNAVRELCEQSMAGNVEQVAGFIEQLPPATLAHATLPVLLSATKLSRSSPAEHAVAWFESLSSSTAYTACAASTLLELSSLSADDQAEQCQQVMAYYRHMAPQHLSSLLLWGTLHQPHPLLGIAPGSQLPQQLPERLQLGLLQAGLAELHRLAEAGDSVDSRLEIRAQILAVVCDLQETCTLTAQQQACVRTVLDTLTAAEAPHVKLEAVDQCLAELVAGGCGLAGVLHVADAMQGLLGSDVPEGAQALHSQAGDRVQTLVLSRLQDSLAAIADTQLTQSAAVSSSTDAHQLPNGHADLLPAAQLDLQHHNHAAAAAAAAAAQCVLGVLHGLQQPGSAARQRELISVLRNQVWQNLQQRLLQTDSGTDSLGSHPAEMQLLECMLNLAEDSNTLKAATGTPHDATQSKSEGQQPRQGVQIRWQGWQGPDGGAQGGGRGLEQALLLSRSMALLQTAFPGAVVKPSDLASVKATQQLFLQLLDDAREVQQLQVLHALLDVWQSGRSPVTDQVCMHCLAVLAVQPDTTSTH